MKNKFNWAICIILMFSGISCIEAQMKIGYVQTDVLISFMPEYKNMTTQIEKLSTTYQEEIKKMVVEIETKYKKYEGEASSVSQEINKQREKELQELQQNIQKKRQEASQSLQNKEKELLKPILEKAQKAIDAVGKDNKYDIILDAKALLYDGGNSNVMELVKKQLGIN